MSWSPPACGVTSPPAYYCELTCSNGGDISSALASLPLGFDSAAAVQVSVMDGREFLDSRRGKVREGWQKST